MLYAITITVLLHSISTKPTAPKGNSTITYAMWTLQNCWPKEPFAQLQFIRQFIRLSQMTTQLEPYLALMNSMQHGNNFVISDNLL